MTPEIPPDHDRIVMLETDHTNTKKQVCKIEKRMEQNQKSILSEVRDMKKEINTKIETLFEQQGKKVSGTAVLIITILVALLGATLGGLITFGLMTAFGG